ncbi:MAG TPA: DegT/DnrJ/EryC1/StrS family aminotransferase [Verrucomicrobiae bacterium]|nr:DegT/DnrJ/EryC1/StrS family aminotransferase [Verrucomicrobiae bacterium]
MQIPFYKPYIDSDEIDEVVQTLKSGWLTTGPRARQFEAEFARYLNHPHAVAVNSCTAALHLALEAIGLKPGQAVLVPTMTFAATAEVVRYFNAIPILVDCRPQDLNMDIADAERKLRAALARDQSVAAILPVHYGGQIGDVSGVQDLAKRYHLRIIEDAAHCCPAFFRVSPGAAWQTVGSTADISCYSFYANKCITTGEGGMACTRRPEYAERMRIMSLHGISKDAWKRFTAQGSWYYEIIAPGFKYNLTDLAAALGLRQLQKADMLHRRRSYLARLYSDQLHDLDELILPQTQPDRVHSWHLYAIRLRLAKLKLDRAQIIDALKKQGIGASVHWLPLHMHPYYRQTYGYDPADLPTAARIYPELITLPLYPSMTEQEVTFVSEALKRILGKALRKSAARRQRPLSRAGAL